MRKITSIAAIGAAFSWQPVVTMAAEKKAEVQYTSLAPSSAWQLDYSPESCNLMRTFGTGDDALTMKMEWVNPGFDSFNTEVTGSYPLNPPAKLTYQFLPNGQETITSNYFYGTDVIDGDRVTTIELPTPIFYGKPPEFEKRKSKSDKKPGQSSDGANASTRGPMPAPIDPAKVQALTFALPGVAYRLEFGSMEKPMHAVRECLDNLLADWGLDPVAMANLRSRPTPVGNPGTWISPDDYPKDALRNEQSAVVAFRLMIDSDGKVSGCKIANLNHDEGFSKLTCELLSKRARFNAAIDANGNPTPSYFISRAIWAVPQW